MARDNRTTVNAWNYSDLHCRLLPSIPMEPDTASPYAETTVSAWKYVAKRVFSRGRRMAKSARPSVTGADVFLLKGCPLSQLAEALRTREEIP